MIRLMKLTICAIVLMLIMMFALKDLSGQIKQDEIESAMVAFCVCQNDKGKSKSRCISDYRESGFFISPYLILTTYRVVESNPRGIYFYRNGKRYSAYPIAFDSDMDIALLESCDMKSTYPLILSNETPLGYPVKTYDNAMGLGVCQYETESESGFISYNKSDDTHVFVNDQPYAIAYSGGPVVNNADGKVVGMNVRPSEEDCKGIVMPVEQINDFLQNSAWKSNKEK